MRSQALRLSRASRAVTIRRPAAAPEKVDKPSGTITKRSGVAAVAAKADEMLGQYDDARAQVMPSAGVAYAADAHSPILREALRSHERVVYKRPQAAPARVHAQTPKSAPVRRDYSLAELEKKPVADLRLMLAERNVAQGNATEKDELAAWVHQHQHLPVVRPNASVGKTPSATVRASQGPRSMNELKQMSVADLHEILDERGVGPGSATEKGELVRWVFQHQDLPVIYTGKQRRRRSRWGYGPGRPYDSPRDRRRKKGIWSRDARGRRSQAA